MRLVRKPTYHADLLSIIHFIADENPNAAIRLHDEIEEKVRGLTTFPYAGRSGRIAGTRELVIPGTASIVVYTVDAELTIWRVLHGARRWPKQLPHP